MRQQLVIELPWPPAKLNPNSRLHWAAKAKAVKKYRTACRIHTDLHHPPAITSPVVNADITFHPPTRRSYDRDNLLARIKAGLDGMCDALGINDALIDEVTIRVREKVRGGMVRVRLEAA